MIAENGMTILEMKAEILRLKQQNDVLMLAHSYVGREISEIADFTGDSYALACRAQKATQKNVLMCGVRFMAETVKILAPEKRVFLSNADAGCPMAEQLDCEMLAALKKQYPNAVTVAYINTTAELKTLCDVCVTSSSAERILRALPEREILFVPDINLGTYIERKLPEKTFHFMQGGCPTHLRANKADVARAKQEHPEALLLAHPECRPEVWELADYVGSTSGIMNYAKESGAKEFIIGTENAIVEHLSAECPEKKFYPLRVDMICHNMKRTTLEHVLECVRGGGEEIVLDPITLHDAKKCIDRMIELGG